MWSEPLCGGDPGEIVNFTDPELEKCILDGLGGNPPPSDITVETAARQTSVSCPGRGITDLGGLEAFTALTSLDLSGNALTGFGISLRSEEHTSELQSLMRISYAVFCLKK